jgi:hypothetical protein
VDQRPVSRREIQRHTGKAKGRTEQREGSSLSIKVVPLTSPPHSARPCACAASFHVSEPCCDGEPYYCHDPSRRRHPGRDAWWWPAGVPLITSLPSTRPPVCEVRRPSSFEAPFVVVPDSGRSNFFFLWVGPVQSRPLSALKRAPVMV